MARDDDEPEDAERERDDEPDDFVPEDVFFVPDPLERDDEPEDFARDDERDDEPEPDERDDDDFDALRERDVPPLPERSAAGISSLTTCLTSCAI